MSYIPLPRVAAAIWCALACSSVAHAENWTYRGHLEDGGRAAQGNYAIRARLFDAAAGGHAVGTAVTIPSVEVRDGSFTTGLDFGIPLAGAPVLWLELEVAAPNEGFVALDARQRFDPKASLAGVCWDTQGNTTVAGDFLGTTNNLPLELKANTLRVARYEPSSISPNVINGTPGNAAGVNVYGAVIAGGGATSDPNLSGEAPNAVNGSYGSIGGGMANATGTSLFATVAGGRANLASSNSATVGGGEMNEASGSGSAVGGGSGNMATKFVATVSGGAGNVASGQRSVVVAGASNTASGDDSMVLGGDFNCAGGSGSAALGNRAKVRPGSFSGLAGDGCGGVPVSGADGTYGDRGTFVWADSTGVDFFSTGVNQFLARADGGVAFNTQPITTNADLTVGTRAATGDADADLYLRARNGKTADIYLRDTDGALVLSASSATGDTHYALGGTPTAGRYIVTGVNGAYLSTGGDWTNASSVAFKHDFQAVDPTAILDKVVALPVQSWEYKGSSEGRHLGPTAEDFQAAFGLNGTDSAHIATVDADGVALLAIKGLAARLDREHADNAELRAENAELQEQVRALAARLDGLLLELEGERR